MDPAFSVATACSAAALAALATCTAAFGAAPPPFVGVGVSAQVVPDVTSSGSATTAVYKTQDLGLPFHAYGDGLTVNIGSRSATVLATPDPTPAGLLGASLQVQDGALGAYAGADLASATSHVRADSAATSVPTSATAQTFLSDYVTWQVTGAPNANVDVHLHVDGALSGIAGAAFYNQQVTLGIGDSGLGWAALTNAFTGTLISSSGLSTWSRTSLLDQSATGFDFTGTVAVADGTRSLVQLGQMLICTDGARCDFDNTAALSFSLPPGVSYRSDSGVLLAVPEPATVATMLVGLFAVLRRARRPAAAPGGRRRQAASAARAAARVTAMSSAVCAALTKPAS